MRWTEYFAALGTWGSPIETIRRLARAETLAVARFETAFWENTAVGMLDLTFAEGAATAVLPGISVDTVKLAQNEGSALFWSPAVVAGCDDAVLTAIEAALTPWLRTLVRGRATSGESIRRYADVPAFDAARERGDLGAAPLGIALPGVAPFAYARRFAAGAAVDVRCRHAARGAAVLRASAAGVTCVDDDAACRWFGVTPGAAQQPVALAIVETFADVPDDVPTVVVRAASEAPAGWRRLPACAPIPMDWPFPFDETDSPAVAFFAVRAPDRATRPRRSAQRPPAQPGSEGRIALLMRSDALVAADGDVDEARELAELLQGIGIDADLFTNDRDVERFKPDLIHVFAAHGDDGWFGAAARLRALRVPYVVSLEPLAEYGLWEERVHTFMSNVIDGEKRTRFRSFLERRALTLPPGEPDVTASADYLRRSDAEAGELLRGAAAVFTADDPQVLRARFELAAGIVAAPGVLLGPEPDEDDPSALVPSRPFALVHVPLVSRSNVLSLVDALRGSGMPLVIAGPVSDVLYAARVARHVLEGIIVIADPSPELVAALYRRATVFIDPAVRPASAVRAQRAALCGALPIVPVTSPLVRMLEHVPTYDSLDRESIRRTLALALAEPDAASSLAARIAAPLVPRSDLRATFSAVLTSYARTAAPAVP